jgi:hypothetical protein
MRKYNYCHLIFFFQGTSKTPSVKTSKSGNTKYFMSPEDCLLSTKKSATSGKKEHTPRTMRNMQKQHRDNERWALYQMEKGAFFICVI